MAKKKQDFELDPYGFDADLDMPDLNFDSLEVKDDRSAVTKVASGVGQGVKDSVMSPSFIRKLIRSSLPDGYGAAMDLADQTAGTVGNLYNDVAKEAKPVIKDLKRVTKRLMPAAEGVLPKKMADKIKKWSETDSDKQSGMMSAEQMREASMQAQLGEIFKFQSEQQAKDKAENETREAIRDSAEHDRHRSSIQQLDAIRTNLVQLTNYQTTVDAAYKRKSLEVQFRHYFVAVDMLAEQKRFNAEAKTNLDGIMKNTGLPDFVKLKNSERLHEVLRNKFIDSINDSVFARRREMIGKIGKSLSGRAMERMRGFMDNFKDGISAADGLADLQEMQADMAAMGGGPSREEMGGQIVGSLAADSLGKRAGKGIRKLIDRYDTNGVIARGGNRATEFTENLPQNLVDYANSDKHDYGIFGGLARVFKDAIMDANREDIGVVSDNMRSMQDPVPFNRRALKSITEIIPGYLARMLRELQITRTGDEKTALTSYDYMSNKFIDKTSLKSSIYRSLVKESDKKATKEQIEEILKEVDPDGTKLNEVERKALGEYLLTNNLSNRSGSKKRLTNYDSYSGQASRYAGKFSDLFSNYFEDDENGVKNIRFARMHNKLGNSISDARAIVQDHINSGNREVLEELGILTPGSDAINMRRLREYMTGDDAVISPDAPQAPNANRTSPTMGRRPQRLQGPIPTPRQRVEPAGPAPIVEMTEVIEALRNSATQTIAAIQEHSSKPESVTINEILLRIEEKINKGVTINFGGAQGGTLDAGGMGGEPGEGGRWWNRSVGNLAGGAWRRGKNLSDRVWGMGKKLGGQAWDNLGKAGDFARDMGNKALDRAKKWNDVYVQGEIVPRLQALKMKAGDHYYVIENGTKKYIKELRDITGDVFGPDGQLVMSFEDAKKAWVKVGPVKKLLNQVVKMKDRVNRFIGQTVSRLPRALSFTADMAKKLYDTLLDGPQDVYIQGNPDPVLLARTMRVGGYASRITSKEIRKVSDIDGPVIDSTGQVVLSAEDLAKGLFDKDGKPIKTGLGKLAGRAQDLLAMGKKYGNRAWNALKDTAKKIGNSISGVFKEGGGIQIGNGMFSNNSYGGGGSTKLLMQIRNLLNTRLPGDPTTFDDADFGRDMLRSVREKGAGLMAKLRGKVPSNPDLVLKAKEMYRGLAERGMTKAEIAKEMGPELFALLKGKGGDFMDRLQNGLKNMSLKNLTMKTKSLFGVFAKKDGLEVSGMTKVADVLAQMRDRMPVVPKKVVGDADGDGVRDGSFKDMMRRKKDALAERLKLGGKDGEAGLLSKLGGMKGLLAKLRGNKDEEEEDEDDEDSFLEEAAETAAGEAIGDRLGGGDSDEKARKKKRKRRLRNARRARGGRFGGLKNMAKGFGGTALKGLGLAGAAYGGYSAYQNLQEGNYGAAALDAGMAGVGAAATLGGVGAIGGGLATAGGLAAAGINGVVGVGGSILAGAAGLISLPVVLGAVAIGGLGYLAYRAYKKKTLDAYSKMRYAQYGFLPNDEDHLQKVFELEDALAKGLVYDRGVARLDEKKIDFKDVVKDFGISLDDPEAVKNWLGWFLNRFKPVYLVHMSALNKVAPGKTLDDVAGLKPEQKKEYLTIAKYPGGPYTATQSPFSDLKSLPAGPDNVKALAEAAEAEVAKEMGTKQGATASGMGAVGAATTAAAAATAGMASPNAQAVKPGVSTTMLAAATVPTSDTGMDSSRGVISVMGVSIGNNQFATGKVDALPAVRYKTYGVKDMALDKLRALDGLEKYINKEIKWGKGNVAQWEGSVEKALMVMGPSFGIDAGTNNDSASWMAWFSNRFLPTYLNYLTAVAQATNKTDINTGYQMLKPQQMVDVAVAVYTSKGSYNGSNVSVWQVPSTPWPNYELNSDVKSVEGNVNGLKEIAKRTVLDEQTGKTPKGQDAQANPQEANTFTGKVKQTIASVWQGVKDMANTVMGRGPTAPIDTQGARDIVQPGGGTGGDINNVPKPTGNKSYAALKDTITAAAKIVGVDENLMATMAAIESGFDYTVKAGTSSATGLFQFTKDTWNWMMKRYASKYGIDPNTPPTDPRANALLGAEYVKININGLKDVVGRPLTDTDLYMAHFLGTGGAKQFLKADPNAIAANVMPKAASANASIFYDGGRPRTFAEIYALMNNKVRTRGKQFGIGAGAEQVKLASKTPPPPATETPAAGGKATGAPAPKAGNAAAATVAAMGAGSNTAPAPKASNALAVPVSDQSPVAAAASTKAAPTPTPAKAAPAPQAQPQQADVVAMASGFLSPKARDSQVQQEFQREQRDAVLGSIETVAKQSLDVQKKQLEAVLSIKDLILKRAQAAPEPQPVPEKAPKMQIQGARNAAAAPVSMAKPQW